MKPLPQVDETLLVRTDFSDETAWKEACAGVKAVDSEMQQALDLFASACESLGQSFEMPKTLLHFVDDPEYQGATTAQLVELATGDSGRCLMFIADETTMSQPEHPILVVDLNLQPGRTFRTIPSQAFGIDTNLSIANMDWEDFAEILDHDGAFRGFGQ